MQLLLLLACPGTADRTADSADVSVCVPEIVVGPPKIEFGEVLVGTTTTATVTVANPGACLLTLHSAAIERPDEGDGFTVAFNGPAVLPPGASAGMTVSFTPTAPGTVTNGLDLRSDAGGDDEAGWVRLVGTGLPSPDLELSPAPLTLAAVEVGCESAGTVELHNAGQAPLTVTGLGIGGGGGLVDLDLTLDGADPLPWTLPPTRSRRVAVRYHPVNDAAVSSTLTVLSDDPDEPEAALAVTATPATWPVAEVYEWYFGRPVDILVVVDTSTGMREFGRLDALDAAWEVLVDGLLAEPLDYQLAVVGEDGCVDGGPVNETDTPADQVAALRTQVPRDEATTAETGFSTLLAATSPAALAVGGCNEGLLRPGARLAVVGVTANAEASGVSHEDLAAQLVSLLTDPDDLEAHAVAGEWPAGCVGAAPGTGWYELVASTDGTYLSICTPGDLPFDTIATTLLDLPATRYELPDYPHAGTLIVEVDGVPVPFTYAAADNLVELDDAPPPGSTVTIRWLPEDYCEDG